jgi:hypothetical protein
MFVPTFQCLCRASAMPVGEGNEEAGVKADERSICNLEWEWGEQMPLIKGSAVGKSSTSSCAWPLQSLLHIHDISLCVR